MKKLYLILSMLVALGTSWTAMAQQQGNPINTTPWREDFTLTDWPYIPGQNGNYNLFSEYPENCWYVPYTILADNGTTSPRLWYNGAGNNRHLSIKEGSNTTKQDQIVALPVFSNSISTLSIQFKSKLNMSGTRTLKIGYYDTSTSAFIELKSISVSGNSDQLYGPYYFGAIANAPTTFNANYRLAFMLPANADGYSCDVKNIVITSTPTQITSDDDWNALCQAVNNGYTYSGKTVTLANDITISKMAGTSKTNSFKGTFDGQGHTITLSGGDFGTSSSPQSNADCAPFRFVAGATFLNLTVAGNIYSSNQRAGGFIGTAGHGDLTFTNCLSAVNIHASRSQNDGTHGGFIGLLQGDNQQNMTATFTGCAYTGRLSTTTSVDNVGGFIGWCEWRNEGSAKGYVTLYLNNCLVAMGATPSGETAINSGKTFARCRNYTNSLGSNDANLNNCYYITLLGDTQGKQAYSVTAVSPATVAMSGSATEYNVSGITAYNTGFVYEGTIYAGEGDNVNLVLNGALDFVADHGTLTGSGSNYTLLMGAYNTEISRVSVCPKPTNVTLTNVMPTSATLNWEGEAERYNVRYGVIGDEVPSFFEDFENGLPSTWTTIDADGDGHNWYGHINNTGSGNLATHSGNGVVASDSYDYGQGALNPDNWLITPQLDLGGRMSVWLRGQENDSDYDEHFAIYLSLTDKNVDDFTIQLVPESVTTDEYVEYAADLSAYSGQQGYIAIRHFNCSDKFILNVDDFYIYVRQETEWTNNVTSSTNSLDITGLTPGTTYEFQVQADCGENNLSVWSAGASFTAPEACGAPNQLAAEVTGNAVELSWEGYQDGYNVRYRTTGFDGIYLYEPLTINQIGDWETDDSGNIGLAYTDEDGTDVCFMFHYSTNPPQLLFSPYFPRPTQKSGTTLQFDYKVHQESYPETFQVQYYDEDNNLLEEEELMTVSNTYWITYRGYVPVGTKRFRIQHLSYDQFYLYLDNFFVYNDDDNEIGEWMAATSDGNTLSLNYSGLEFERLYEWQVQGIDCDGEGGTTGWSEAATFTTPDPCSAPTDLNATNITAISACLNWTGVQGSYDVRYRKVAHTERLFSEGFEDGIPSTWTIIDADGDGHNWLTLSDIPYVYEAYSDKDFSEWAHSGFEAAASPSYANGIGGFNSDQWLISPQLPLRGVLQFYASSTNSALESYEVLLSTTGTATTDFTVTLQAMKDAPFATPTGTDDWDNVQIDLSAYAGQLGYIAIHHVSSDKYFLVVDDFEIHEDFSEDWTTATVENGATSINIDGLRYSTEYEWQIQGVSAECDDLEWVAGPNFTTSQGYIKHIDPYTTDGGYYLIASPIGQVNPSNVDGMLDNEYDLYYFDQAQDKEWINYKGDDNYNQANFDLIPGKGYLYANSGNNGHGVDLVFAGLANTEVTEVTLALESGVDFEGWNLVGNPFAVEAYIDRDFYRLAEGGAEVMSQTSSGAIEPMEGVFVNANSDGETLTFSTEAPAKNASLALNVTKGASTGSTTLIDRAIVRFGEGRQLPKFQLRKNSTKVYIPQDGKDYAVVNADQMGEVPVSFVAEENGSYTITINPEGVDMAYLHLIDNMTGADVDLLSYEGVIAGEKPQSPTLSYTFTAKTTDYANRFKLVFAIGSSTGSDAFAFYSNGSFVINNEGNATLQVIDLNGRILKSESINGSASLNVKAAAGVYMLRLINGNDVKVQKIVIE